VSESVFELLRKRYPLPAWAFLEEVRNGTGFGKVTRTADALAMSLYPSRGLHLHGFEVKVSRGDWLRELANPAKADEIAKWCHFWWVVTDDSAGPIVKPGELPATWGHLSSDGKKLQLAREATLNSEALAPTHKFLGAILRRVCSTATDQTRLDRAKGEGHAEGFEQGKKYALDHSADGRAQKRFDELHAKVRAYEEASGVNIQFGEPKRIGTAARFLSGGYGSPLEAFGRLAKEAKRVAKMCDEAMGEIRPLFPVDDAGDATPGGSP
jgi:hypothetical protein